MDERFEDLLAYLRGRRPMLKTDSPQRFVDYLEQEIRPLLESADVSVKRGPGRPRKEDAACV